MKKIALLYICTGKYTVFWPEFYHSAEKYFLNTCEVHYYVFTDSQSVEYQDMNSRIHLIPQEAYHWPYSTLMRFSIFLQCEAQLLEYDYIFFFNANAQFNRKITEGMFLPRQEFGEELLVVQHPGFYNKNNFDFTYDRNPKCSAYIPYWAGKVYVCGGVNGGTSRAFLEMCKILSERIDADLDKNIIPLWHDESQINRYILHRKDYRLLPPSFCFPEKWDLPFECNVLIRDKKNYFDVNDIRKDAPETRVAFHNRILNHISRNIMRFITYIRGKLSGGK